MEGDIISTNNNKNNKKTINFNDINYAIYNIGSWKNSYEINLIGTSNEIPATESTRDHVIMSMDEIRKASFEINDKTLNGVVALSIQLNDKFKEMDINELIAKEEKEYDDIMEELSNLDLESSDDSVKLDNEKFLIYKLEKDHHVTVSKPANDFTMNHHMEEIKKLKN
ncbi:MAG: hypothetical protein ACRCVG_06960 [Methanobacteriaceae archaeon]